MSEEDLWFEPVDLLSTCSLNEGLLWVWAERVPVFNIYREKNAFETLQDWECEELAIPAVPEGVRRGAQYITEERLVSRNREFGNLPKDAADYRVAKGLEEAEAVRQWLLAITRAMELPATELFLKLRRGKIEATGKELPEGVAIIDFLEDQSPYSAARFNELPDTVIPHDFWTMPMSVEVLMRVFPGERRPVHGAEFVGNCLLVKEPSADNLRPPTRMKGRPPLFAWEAFHVEVADLISSGRMPPKKEAAIQLMLSWFESAQKQKPSRSAVSEKLTPYYRKFFSGRS
jgi:hypothetical protein